MIYLRNEHNLDISYLAQKSNSKQIVGVVNDEDLEVNVKKVI
jgi:hypothetical protein